MPLAGRWHKTRGRRTLLWTAGVFLLLQLGGGLVLDYALPQIRFPVAYDCLRRLDARPRSPDVIVMGSSRLEGFVHESELTHELRALTGRPDLRAFNASFEGGDFIAQEFLLRRMLARGARPKVLVLETSPEMLNAFNEFYRLHVFRQLRWEDLPTHLPEAIATVSPLQLLSDRFLALYRHRYELVKRASGWGANRKPTDLLPRSPVTEAEYAAMLTDQPLSAAQVAFQTGFRKEAKDRPYLRNYRLGGQVARSLERILESCREHGITPVMVGAPVIAEYRSRYTPAIQAQYAAFLVGLREKYGVRYVECRAALPDHLFSDTHHAQPGSSVAFSRLLAREVLAGLWASPEAAPPAELRYERPLPEESPSPPDRVGRPAMEGTLTGRRGNTSK